MTTITMTFTKEQLVASAHSRIEFAEMMLTGELEPLKERTWSIELELARIAMASLEADSNINNHPAHSPLTSRRLHQMRDILSKAAAQRDGGDIGYAMSDAVKLINEVILARNSEPVAWMHVNSVGERAISYGNPSNGGWDISGWDSEPLYKSALHGLLTITNTDI
ncbi:hypothetical protein [Citrobacter sp. R56]|uniref:hypothetical protein n=1 Tax=Citrobacter sp. R56 TaxID=1573676 RepID=UPI00193C858E|nr:hypothetical protein [Citrobacter sp. R56]QRG80910.1 hypothetical protein JM656_09600 [Citrobacter sp. R56]